MAGRSAYGGSTYGGPISTYGGSTASRRTVRSHAPPPSSYSRHDRSVASRVSTSSSRYDELTDPDPSDSISQVSSTSRRSSTSRSRAPSSYSTSSRQSSSRSSHYDDDMALVPRASSRVASSYGGSTASSYTASMAASSASRSSRMSSSSRQSEASNATASTIRPANSSGAAQNYDYSQYLPASARNGRVVSQVVCYPSPGSTININIRH